jgi:hypothetical protein
VSFDDVDFSDEDKVPILCPLCSDAHYRGPVLGFVFKDDELVTCPQCGLEGCVHWCDGVKCDWCVNGVPTGDECEGESES